MASSDYIREIIIVSNPANQFVPSKEDLRELEICGVETKPRPVRNLPQTDFYEKYEHAKPVTKKKINEPLQRGSSVGTGIEGVKMYCQCMSNQNSQPAPEMLCMNCRPLGPCPEWEAQSSTTLPYNIRNYQAKLVENLRRVQQFGVDSF